MLRRRLLYVWPVLMSVSLLMPGVVTGTEPQKPKTLLSKGLVGYWPLKGDCRDHSGQGNHGVNHGVNLQTGNFDGRKAYIEIPHQASLELGTKDFSVAAWVHTSEVVDDVLGDVVSKFDPAQRKGLTLNLKASSGGYQSSGDDRHVYFGIDNAKLSDWQDCGRPSPTSNYVSNSLTVYNGNLYAAITDAKDKEDWCHVYRYEGAEKWIDCGRVGSGNTTGVMSLIVHQGSLYAATTTYDWTRVFSGDYDNARVYRYQGGTKWEDCGQPGSMLRINCMASYGGKLYAGGDRGMLQPGESQWKGRPYHVYEYEGGTKWKASATFPAEKPHHCYPHAMAVHDGKLYVGYPNVYSFDGQEWKFAGTPSGNTPEEMLPLLQVHSLEVHQGQLYAGMWPEARAVVHRGGQEWEDRGRLGAGTEVNALTVYNGMLYGGAIPFAEVTRYDGDSQWTSLRKFYSPEGWTPAAVVKPTAEEVNEWTRVTSLTVFNGRLFASIGSCTASVKDAPADVRGKVFSIEAGKNAAYDEDLGPGWNHLLAVKKQGKLLLYVNGKLVAESAEFDPAEYDLTNRESLKIGFGEMDYFSGKIREVRLYRRALNEKEIQEVQKVNTPE